MESMYRGVAQEKKKKKRWSKNMESITTNPTLQGSVRMSLRWKSSTKQNLRKVCRRSLLMKMVISWEETGGFVKGTVSIFYDGEKIYDLETGSAKEAGR